MKREYPIIEFDSTSENVINAVHNVDKSIIVPKQCVISFFGDAVKDFIKENDCKYIGSLKMETFELPLYVFCDENGYEIAILHGFGSGPYAAGQLEKLISLGCNRFMICGGCGVLKKGSKVGDILIPITALRDEGTSYHYVKPSREIDMNSSVVNEICSYFNKNGITYKCVKTWTTDAMYRESNDMISLRIHEGCHVVEMECASYLAVAKYKNVALGQILYAGDDLSGKVWDSRSWKNEKEIRKILLRHAINLSTRINL